MRAFKVELNGRRLCVAGVGTNGVVSVIATCVRHSPRRGSYLDLSVGGLFSDTGEHAKWLRIRLKVGDKIVLRVLETDSVDQPRSRWSFDPKLNERHEKDYARRIAKKHGWQIVMRPRRKLK